MIRYEDYCDIKKIGGIVIHERMCLWLLLVSQIGVVRCLPNPANHGIFVAQNIGRVTKYHGNTVNLGVGSQISQSWLNKYFGKCVGSYEIGISYEGGNCREKLKNKNEPIASALRCQVMCLHEESCLYWTYGRNIICCIHTEETKKIRQIEGWVSGKRNACPTVDEDVYRGMKSFQHDYADKIEKSANNAANIRETCQWSEWSSCKDGWQTKNCISENFWNSTTRACVESGDVIEESGYQYAMGLACQWSEWSSCKDRWQTSNCKFESFWNSMTRACGISDVNEESGHVHEQRLGTSDANEESGHLYEQRSVGCYLKGNCANNRREYEQRTYDDYGCQNLNACSDKTACMERAEYIHIFCENTSEQKFKSIFVDSTGLQTVYSFPKVNEDVYQGMKSRRFDYEDKIKKNANNAVNINEIGCYLKGNCANNKREYEQRTYDEYGCQNKNACSDKTACMERAERIYRFCENTSEQKFKSIFVDSTGLQTVFYFPKVDKDVYQGMKSLRYDYEDKIEKNANNDLNINEKCQKGNGKTYRGTVNKNHYGNKCQKWSSMRPHSHNQMSLSLQKQQAFGIGDHNYCRNPDGAKGVWCYGLSDKRWDYCNVPKCDNEEKIEKNAAANPREKCQKGNGVTYRGTMDQNKGKNKCQKWTSQKPNQHMHHKLGDHNYCRNPDGAEGVWCYGLSGKRWDYCDVQKCDGEESNNRDDDDNTKKRHKNTYKKHKGYKKDKKKKYKRRHKKLNRYKKHKRS